jgi:hypothetical protein
MRAIGGGNMLRLHAEKAGEDQPAARPDRVGEAGRERHEGCCEDIGEDQIMGCGAEDER